MWICIIKNNWFNREFLTRPSKAAAEKIGHPYHSNATWLVVVEEGHKLYGSQLTDAMVGLGTENKPVVYTGEGFAVNDAVEKAELEFSGKVRLATGEEVAVKTSFTNRRAKPIKKLNNKHEKG